MDILNDLFVNIYLWLNELIRGLLSGAGLEKYAVDFFAALVMGLIVVIVLVAFAPFLTLTLTFMERKVVARIQNRLGPNRLGPGGFFIIFADMIKMLTKEDIVPFNADRLVHTLAPILAMVPITLILAVIPWGRAMTPVDLNIGVLYVIALSSLGTVAIFMAGWGSNNKFALIGGMRAVAQILSYEVPQVLTIVVVVLMAGSLSLVKIVEAQGGWNGFRWFLFAFPVGPIAFIIFLISAVAEVNRTPFDLPEGESEIVAGHMTEYSGMKWGLFYMAEYLNLFVVSAIGATLFLGGWQGPILPPWIWFFAKTFALVFLAMWVRGTFPRLRMDQLMKFAWQVLVPVSLANIVLTSLALPLIYQIFRS
ncbi:MAG: NADH-quinone oxidoreductase subunit NuoH [Chloroflexi bacterium]|nr:NADH-quinone oxidoreductase subunit NuoH [Chloroflexota bacterium]